MERDALNRLTATLTGAGGLPKDCARLLARLSTAPITRPKAELIDHLSRYDEVSSGSLPQCVNDLIAANLIESVDVDGMAYFRLKTEWMEILAQSTSINTAQLAREVRQARSSVNPNSWELRDLGPVVGSNEYQYRSWLAAIDEAKHEILIWTTSSAYPEVLSAVERAAGRGVQIKVIIGSQHAVEGIRGASEARRAADSARTWRTAARRRTEIMVRSAQREEDLSGAGSTLIDRRLLRTTIYDYRRQTGSSGRMLELKNTFSAHSLNLISAYELLFNDAWSRSKPELALPFASIRRGSQWFGWRVSRGRHVRWLIFTAILLAGPAFVKAKWPEIGALPWFEGMYEVAKAAGAATIVLAGQALVDQWQRSRRLRERREW